MSKSKDTSSETTQMKIALLNRQVANIVVAVDYDEDGNAVPTIVFCGDQSSAANALFDDLKEYSHDTHSLHVFENVPFNCMLASPYGDDDDDDGSESDGSESDDGSHASGLDSDFDSHAEKKNPD